MSELFDEGSEPGQNIPEFSVSEISGAVKRAVEQGFSHVKVRAEVGRVSLPRSGHVYLDLKDDRAVLAGVIWKGVAARLSTRPEEGMEVVATGRLTTFPGQSKYQMVIEDIAPAGVGALMAMLEKRKAALAQEGLFAAERKQPLPYLPEVIGVVTSPSGAVIRDILHRLRDRFPRQVLVWPVAVQGAKCAPEVAAAIAGFNALNPAGPIPRPDVLIVARGGGSIEDLWGFNEEAVVRVAAASTIPLISAVGHETDTTLIDLASDRRAPTPTAAAEMAVPVRSELAATLAGFEARRIRGLQALLLHRAEKLRDLSRLLPRAETLVTDASQMLDGLSVRLAGGLRAFLGEKRTILSQRGGAQFGPRLLRAPLAEQRNRLSDWSARLSPSLTRILTQAVERVASRAVSTQWVERPVAEGRVQLTQLTARFASAGPRALEQAHDRLHTLDRMLQSMSYKATLARGYAVVRNDRGMVISDAKEAKAAARLDIEFQGDAHVQVTPNEAGRANPRAAPSKAKAKPKGDPQGSLF